MISPDARPRSSAIRMNCGRRDCSRRVLEHEQAAGHACLGWLAQGTLCDILNEQEIKPHKVRYYLERRDLESGWSAFLDTYRQTLLSQTLSMKTG